MCVNQDSMSDLGKLELVQLLLLESGARIRPWLYSIHRLLLLQAKQHTNTVISHGLHNAACIQHHITSQVVVKLTDVV